MFKGKWSQAQEQMGLSRKIKMLELRMPGGIIPARYLYLNHSKCFLVFGAWFHMT